MNKQTMIALVIGLIIVLGVGYALYISQMNKSEEEMMDEENTTMSSEVTTEEGEMMSEETPATMMSEETPVTMMNEGPLAPDFTLMDTQGNLVKLSDLKGEKVYIKFWASWCSICLAGLDEVDQLAGEDNGFKVISIVSPGFKGEQNKEDFLKWFSGIDVKHLTVLLDINGDVASAYGVRAYPTSAYIGTDSILIKALAGHVANGGIIETMNSVK